LAGYWTIQRENISGLHRLSTTTASELSVSTQPRPICDIGRDKVALMIAKLPAVLDSVPQACHAAVHNYILRCNIGVVPMLDFAS